MSSKSSIASSSYGGERLSPEEGILLEQDPTESSSSVSIANNVNKFSSFASLAIFKDGGEVFFQNSKKRCSGVLLQGPRKFIRLCLFGFILPVLLISIPLYVRLILYPPHHYSMAPTDQRLLNQQSSSIWCQAQTVKMNGSFNAYLLDKSPTKSKHFSTHTMQKHLTLKDDVKEYWGFFLQKGSIVTFNLCTRYDGGILMIMKGVTNLRKCAWVGEEDSAEQDEDDMDTSNESGEPPEVHYGTVQNHTEEDFMQDKNFIAKEIVKMSSSEKKHALDYYVQKILRLGKNKQEILQLLSKMVFPVNKVNMNLENDTVNMELQNVTENTKMQNVNDETKMANITEEVTLLNGTEGVTMQKISNKVKIQKDSESNKKRLVKRSIRVKSSNLVRKLKISTSKVLNRPPTLTKLNRIKRTLENNINDGAFEIVNDIDLYEEEVSHFRQNSSMEMPSYVKEKYLSLFHLPSGLTYERGKFNQTHSHDKSNEEERSSFSSSEEALTKCSGLQGLIPLFQNRQCNSFNDTCKNRITYKIPSTGTYYFVFSSDNEVFDSEIYLNMTLQKVVFDTQNAINTCHNETSCSLAFSFWSHDQAIVEVPEGNWDSAYTLEVICKPRVSIYLGILIFVPIIFLFCALQ